jgi:hypothetical protein
MSQPTAVPSRRRNRIAASLALAAAAAAALVMSPGADAAFVKFGASLNPSVQPSNSSEPEPCTHQDAGDPCTRILVDAYGRPNGGDRAPRGGTIRRIRLIAGAPGSFRLQIAKVRRATLNQTNEARVLRSGPVITYRGQSQSNFDSDVYRVESFPVNVHVNAGESLAMRSRYTSAMRCSSGGTNQLIFQPPLLAGGGFEQASSTEGCWLLLEAVIRY